MGRKTVREAHRGLVQFAIAPLPIGCSDGGPLRSVGSEVTQCVDGRCHGVSSRRLPLNVASPRPPARHALAVMAVLLAETRSQPGLFVEPDINNVDHDEAGEPPRERRRAQPQRFPCEYEKQAGLHRIAAVAVGAGADELARGVPRRQRAVPMPHEQQNAMDRQCDAETDEQRSSDAGRNCAVLALRDAAPGHAASSTLGIATVFMNGSNAMARRWRHVPTASFVPCASDGLIAVGAPREGGRRTRHPGCVPPSPAGCGRSTCPNRCAHRPAGARRRGTAGAAKARDNGIRS